MKKRMMLATVAALAALAAGCSSSDSPALTVTITTESMSYASKEIALEKGKPVKLVLVNKDTVEHDFSIDKIPGQVKGAHAHAGHSASKAAVHLHAGPGQTETVTFTPIESGTYTFYCTVSGHREGGMEGQLIVN